MRTATEPVTLPNQILYVPEECKHCEGDGQLDTPSGIPTICPICGGTGRI